MSKAKRIIIALCIIVIGISGVYLHDIFIQNKKSENIFQDTVNSLITDTVKDEEALKAEYRKKYPNVKFPDNLLLKYYPVYAENQDIRGWISIPEYKINYPIMQGPDNNYYLRRNIKKEYDVWGTPFFNSSNKFNPNDQNLIVFGHNSSGVKKMFATMNDYLTVDGYKKAPVIECDTIYQEIYWKVYAVYITNSKRSDDNGQIFNYIINNFNENEFSEYINNINKRAIYNTGVDINSNDKILTISTCNYSFKDARMVIVCRQIRPGESKDVNLSLVKKNPNPQYPQAWYDKKRINNPFK